MLTAAEELLLLTDNIYKLKIKKPNETRHKIPSLTYNLTGQPPGHDINVLGRNKKCFRYHTSRNYRKMFFFLRIFVRILTLENI